MSCTGHGLLQASVGGQIESVTARTFLGLGGGEVDAATATRHTPHAT